jgi:membrane-associated phospholipid phosphatase
MIPAAGIGFIVPIYLPLILFLAGGVMKKSSYWTAGFALVQAELIGLVISSAYKAFTGRAHPLHHGTVDISRDFHFGWLRGGMFWGWPSSHTTIAFAMAVTLCRLFPKQRWLTAGAMGYAFYIGLGVSTTIHWFSDFAAGAMVGTVVGLVAGKSCRLCRNDALPP